MPASITGLLRTDIAALEPYTPIVPLETLAERLGLPVERIIKLDANENPYGPSPHALAALAAVERDAPHRYAIYPTRITSVCGGAQPVHRSTARADHLRRRIR